jgi:hypothetical protein
MSSFGTVGGIWFLWSADKRESFPGVWWSFGNGLFNDIIERWGIVE